MNKADLKIDELHTLARKLIKANEPQHFITDELCKQGISQDYATTIIDNVLNDNRDRKDFWKLLVMGCFFIISGIAISYVSYSAASKSSMGSYFIFWGLVVTGVIMIFRAFALYRK